MAEVKETSVDVIAEIRDLAANRDWHNHTNQSNRERVSDIADRLEVALRRERATTENSSAVGDTQKMRGALALCNAMLRRLDERALNETMSCIAEEARVKVAEALAAPPRNCDVGTADEQYERWLEFCGRYDHACAGCPFDDYDRSLAYCFAGWAQMPYEEGGEE